MKKILMTAMAVSLFALSAEAQYYGNQAYGNQGYNQGYAQPRSRYQNQGYNRNGQRASQQRRRATGASSRATSRKRQKQNEWSFYVAPRVGVGTSFGWISGYDNPIVPQLAIAGGFSYGNLRAELEFDYHFEGELASWGSGDFGGELNFSQYNFAINGYYDFMPNSSFRPFVGVGLGVSNVEISEKISTPYGSESLSVSDTKPMFSLMGGATWHMTDHMALEGMARYRYIPIDGDTGRSLSNVEALIGMRFSF